MKSYKIASIAGDGIGKEVLPESLKIIKETAKKHQFKIQFDEFEFASCYYYKKHRNVANILLLSIISIASISIFAIREWMIICIFVLSIIGFLIRRWDTSPIIYGYFLSDLFYENLIRTLIIL